MKELYGMNLRGQLHIFYSRVLSQRKLRVREGTSVFDLNDQEMGVPHNSILSATLYTAKIMSIISCMKDCVDNSLFVDDIGILYWSKHAQAIERQLQVYKMELKVGLIKLVLNSFVPHVKCLRKICHGLMVTMSGFQA